MSVLQVPGSTYDVKPVVAHLALKIGRRISSLYKRVSN
jgi:hypothetical protein